MDHAILSVQELGLCRGLSMPYGVSKVLWPVGFVV